MSLADDLDDLASDGVEADPQTFQAARCNTLTLVDEAEQDVLCADVIVIEEPGFFLREYYDSASPVCKAFKHSPYTSYQGETCLSQACKDKALPNNSKR